MPDPSTMTPAFLNVEDGAVLSEAGAKVIADVFDEALRQELNATRSTKASDVLGWMDSEGPVTRAPGKPT
jgi:hypothetical protein